MSATLHPKAAFVQAELTRSGLDCQVIEMPDSTRTAQEAADAIGTTIAQIVKSLVFRGKSSGQAVIVLASGVNRVDEKRIREYAGETIEKADADFVREQTGYAIGGVAPLGYPQPLTTFIDEDLLQYDEIWAAAGTPHAVFRLTPDELLKLSGGEVKLVKKAA
jgi:prolyl-tRNA editing enzyme YbaK/EbsC (Cys-tRNA(Pro) deacylase)